MIQNLRPGLKVGGAQGSCYRKEARAGGLAPIGPVVRVHVGAGADETLQTPSSLQYGLYHQIVGGLPVFVENATDNVSDKVGRDSAFKSADRIEVITAESCVVPLAKGASGQRASTGRDPTATGPLPKVVAGIVVEISDRTA
jgi:hypothetical protein